MSNHRRPIFLPLLALSQFGLWVSWAAGVGDHHQSHAFSIAYTAAVFMALGAQAQRVFGADRTP